MTVHREAQWLTATRSEHVAYEVSPGEFRLSFVPERLVTGVQAVAGLQVAEVVAQWNQLLWEPSPNTGMVWRLLAGLGKPLGLDVLDLVIRIEQQGWSR